jgi:hypothetical protein
VKDPACLAQGDASKQVTQEEAYELACNTAALATALRLVKLASELTVSPRALSSLRVAKIDEAHRVACDERDLYYQIARPNENQLLAEARSRLLYGD